jgi:RNA polymerase sigma factor (sigma-70 family)
LLRGCLRHEPAAQEAFYRYFAPCLLHICVRYARSRTQAEDLVQEAFIRVFERLGQYRNEGSLEGWVRRVAVNTCLDHYRAEARRWQEFDLDAAADLSSDDADALSRLAAQDLVALIARLPDHYRLVINLYCVEGYTHKEIGDQLGLDEHTSSSQLSRARRLLAELVRRSERILSNELS